MLLDLLHSELTYKRVSVSSLSLAANVPATTALRWIKLLVEQRLIVRQPDPADGRRVFVELNPDVSKSLRQYFAEVVQET
jgi:DNA-binding MarR family transcriptional regulator